jgi:hypothetical protein
MTHMKVGVEYMPRSVVTGVRGSSDKVDTRGASYEKTSLPSATCSPTVTADSAEPRCVPRAAQQRTDDQDCHSVLSHVLTPSRATPHMLYVPSEEPTRSMRMGLRASMPGASTAQVPGALSELAPANLSNLALAA